MSAMFNKNEPDYSSKKLETIIGPSVRVEGNFKGQGDLLIEGILVGNLDTENNLKIGSGAIVQANIKANNAFVSGKVKGNIIISGKLELASSAIVLGDIKTQLLSIESGALVQGKIIMPTGKVAVETTVNKKEELPEPTDDKKVKTINEK